MRQNGEVLEVRGMSVVADAGSLFRDEYDFRCGKYLEFAHVDLFWHLWALGGEYCY